MELRRGEEGEPHDSQQRAGRVDRQSIFVNRNVPRSYLSHQPPLSFALSDVTCLPFAPS